MSTIRVLIADDHTLVRAGMRMLLENIEGIQVVAEASDGREILTLVERYQPHIVLTDIAMPGLNGLEAISRLKQSNPTLHIIVLSMHTTEEYVREALTSGAQGYLIKGADPSELTLALKAVIRGETYLSPAVSKSVITGFLEMNGHEPIRGKALTSRQREILQLIAEGQSTKNIAQLLNVSVKTVETHRTELMNRLDIHEVAGLVRYAIRQGIISSET
jgi:DNA-binding NarL/FixJ family response regulator